MKEKRAMTLDDVQSEAMIIESLLEAVQSMWGEKDGEQALTLVVWAHQRAERLTEATDSVNRLEAVASTQSAVREGAVVVASEG